MSAPMSTVVVDEDGIVVEEQAIEYKPQRSFRVEGELWDAAKAKARSEGMPLSQVLRHFLVGYVK